MHTDLEQAKDSMYSFSFNALEYSDDDLTVLIGELFHQVKKIKFRPFVIVCNVRFASQLAAKQEISIIFDSLKVFILAVRAGMPRNPYHNWKHIIDVTQVTKLMFLSKSAELQFSAIRFPRWPTCWLKKGAFGSH